MPVELTDGRLRERIAPWLAAGRSRVWLATPFLSFRIAYWVATTRAAAAGDRRLLVAWDARSLDDLYLSAAGVDALRLAGFAVRNLPRLHAKVVVAGSRAYAGSGNLTAFGLDGGNVELGAFASGDAAAAVAAAFERWWAAGVEVDADAIAAAVRRQTRLADARSRGLDLEVQPGHQPRVPAAPAAAVLPPDPRPAAAASPTAVVHFWRGDTVARSLRAAGRAHCRFASSAPMVGALSPGTRVYTVSWAPMGGLLLMNRFTIATVRREGDAWRVAGRDATPLRFDRVVAGADYARDVRLRDQRQAPEHYMAFSPLAYLSQRTVDAFDRAIDAEG